MRAWTKNPIQLSISIFATPVSDTVGAPGIAALEKKAALTSDCGSLLAALPPMARRAAFVAAGMLWSLLLALPAIVASAPIERRELALATGAAS